MIRLVYWMYRKIFELPCRTEVLEVLMDGKALHKDIHKLAVDYAMGYTIEESAWMNNITRERARQYLFKAVRS
jgi:hypothetical protein